MNSKQITDFFETAVCFCFIKIKKEQENKENTSGKNAFICFFSIYLSIYNKTETSDGEARRNHPIPTG